MNEFRIDNKFFGLFKSKKRLKILKFFMNNNGSFHFNEIAKELGILPSTLEYHIKQLTDLGLITHIDNQYRNNAYTKLIRGAFHGLSNLKPLINFLKTHDFPIINPILLNEFLLLKIQVIPDMVSLLSFMNLELEEKMMRFSEWEFKIDEIEIITNYDNFIKFINYINFDYFLSFSNLDDIKLFLVKDCNFYMALLDEIGVLFLPEVNNRVDFQLCLVFEGERNIQWLRKVFKYLKNSSREIALTEDLIKDKSLFISYLNELVKLK
ncbi:MAG: ArsR family transcriptional regulator [Candidatus Lokiarchaeota archaeon]